MPRSDKLADREGKKGKSKRRTQDSGRSVFRDGLATLTNSVGTVACIIASILIASFVMGIIALLQIKDIKSDINVASASGTQAGMHSFQLTALTEQINDDMWCIRDAPLPMHMRTGTNDMRRTEGFIHMLRVRGAGAPWDVAVNSTDLTSCSTDILAGSRWKTPMKFVIDPSNDADYNHADVVRAWQHSANQWNARLRNPIVSGQDMSTCVDGFDSTRPDGKNEIMFGYIQVPGVLATAITWRIRAATTSQQDIIETDIIYNLQYSWSFSAAGDPEAFDMENTGTHETGHAIGKGHVTRDGATMYPSATKGETEKRTLLACEAEGLCQLYAQAGDCALGTSAPMEWLVPTACDGAYNGGEGGFGESGSGASQLSAALSWVCWYLVLEFLL